MEANHTRKRSRRGFSLLELMVSLAILSAVIGVVVQGIRTIQVRNTSDTNKVGLTQESRQFMDQILRDLRQSGNPSLAMFDVATLSSTGCSPAGVACCNANTNVACGLTSFSASAITFEGDIDGSGVSQITVKLAQDVNGAACTAVPCVLLRGTVLKTIGGTPPYFTQLTGVMNTSIFTATKYDGSAYNSSTDSLSMIRNVGLSLYVRSTQADLDTGTYPEVTLVSAARLNNGSDDQ
jgi:prepilin-type N-terminal cleavage/methylation domain-containing protein